MEEFIVRKEQVFFPNQRFRHINIGTYANKTGTVLYLRDDTYEKNSRALDKTHYNYSVKFDDGTSETYLNQMFMAQQ
jgi:hypothetical protein